MTDIPALFSLHGRTALVTGASGGLGLHFAKVLYEAGAKVILAARRADRIEAEAARLGERAGAVPMDVSDNESIAHGLDRIAEAHGICDIVVNNAGISGHSVALKMEPDEWDDVVRVNLRGPFFVARDAARRLVEAKKPGSIINIASILGLRGLAGVPAYMATKAGLLHLTRSLALELARYQIRVNAICPGYFRTDISGDFLKSEFGQAMVKRIPQRRLGELQDLNGPLLLLASEAGAHMTGATVVVDGGHTIGSL